MAQLWRRYEAETIPKMGTEWPDYGTDMTQKLSRKWEQKRPKYGVDMKQKRSSEGEQKRPDYLDI